MGFKKILLYILPYRLAIWFWKRFDIVPIREWTLDKQQFDIHYIDEEYPFIEWVKK